MSSHCKNCGYADGGEVAPKGSEAEMISKYGKGSKEHRQYQAILGEHDIVDRHGDQSPEHKQYQKGMRKSGIPVVGKLGLAEGGGVDDDGIVDRIMLKMSGGGMVARDEAVDEEPNEFDEMKLRGEPESLGDGDDEIGDEAEDDDRHDTVSRIMRSLSKRDRMPRPA